MNDYQALINSMLGGPLEQWAKLLPEQIRQGLDVKQYGDLPKWQAVLASLPHIEPSVLDLDTDCIQIGKAEDLGPAQQSELHAQLQQLHPWRKGPFNLFDIHIDTEWRSDWKWLRLKDHIQPLTGKTVLDVGCGNGYHCWRMKGAGAERVIGIDPTPYSVMQYQAVRHFVGEIQVDVLPLGIDDVPPNLEAFDSVFSMGVLYHRRSPLDHILQLKDCLKPGGELVLETLVIEGGDYEVLLPDDRYARMRNVWFIPTVQQLDRWLRRCGMKNIRVVDINQTSVEEQRSTEWMRFESLQECLDPHDSNKTLEGYPAPRRAIVISQK